MSWYREDDKLHKSPEWVAVGAEVYRLHASDPRAARQLAKDAKLLQNTAGNWGAGCNCDGIIHVAAVPQIAAESSMTEEEVHAAAAVLVAVGFWKKLSKKKGPGWEIIDWLDSQPARAQVARAAERSKRKQDLYRTAEGRALIARIRDRDGDLCRYCAVEVKWEDRRSVRAGTYDHVDPEAGNTFENLVVACGHCNRVKSDRTPAEAGMELLPPPAARRYRSGSTRDQNAIQSRPARDEGPGRVRSGQIGSELVGVGAGRVVPESGLDGAVRGSTGRNGDAEHHPFSEAHSRDERGHGYAVD